MKCYCNAFVCHHDSRQCWRYNRRGSWQWHYTTVFFGQLLTFAGHSLVYKAGSHISIGLSARSRMEPDSYFPSWSLQCLAHSRCLRSSGHLTRVSQNCVKAQFKPSISCYISYWANSQARSVFSCPGNWDLHCRFPGSQPSDLDWNYTTDFLEPAACHWQIVELLSPHNHVSQFL